MAVEAIGAPVGERQVINQPSGTAREVLNSTISQYGEISMVKGTPTVVYQGRDARGYPVYYISFTFQPFMGEPQTVRNTVAWNGSSIVGPNFSTPGGGGVSEPSAPDPSGLRVTEERMLNEAKLKFNNWLVSNESLLSDAEMEAWKKYADNFTGSAAAFNNWWNIIKTETQGTTSTLEFIPNDPGAGTSTGGGIGGGGFVGPTYVAPDRRVVEDYVKGTMVSLVGTVLDDKLDQIVDVYMKDHRRNFDNPQQEIDPGQSVVEAIRSTEDYNQIHKLRPESADERSWIKDRRAAAQQGGLQVDRQEDFARTQAAVGGDVDDVRDAAAVRQTTGSGTTRGTVLEKKVRGAAEALFQGVR